MVDSHKKVLKFCHYIKNQEIDQQDRVRLFKPKVVDTTSPEKEEQKFAMEFSWSSLKSNNS